MLKSNGLRHPKNLPVKFGFSPINTPANIVKKLPPQRCLQPFLIPLFNFSHKRPTFAFTGEIGYTLGFRRRIAHSGSHALTGASPPSATAWSCATSEITLYAVFVTPDSAALLYTYISRFSENPHHQQQLYLRPSFIPIFNFSHKRPTFAFTGESGYTLGSPRKIAHKGTHGETRSFTLVVALRFISHLTFGQAKAEGSGCTPTACVRFLRRRGPAGLCNTLFNLPICISHALRMGISAHARWKRYHYPRRTPHVVETPGARLSKRLIYRFLTVKQELLFARRLFSCE